MFLQITLQKSSLDRTNRINIGDPSLHNINKNKIEPVYPHIDFNQFLKSLKTMNKKIMYYETNMIVECFYSHFRQHA